MASTLKGKYRCTNPDKYKGDPGNIFYRSSWERDFCKFCDTREQIIWWQSEEKRIRYYDPVSKKWRTYFPDFYIAIKGKDGIIREELVEVKPWKQVKGPPTNPKRRTKSWLNEVHTYVTNQAKWKAAREWCEDRGSNFRIITEKDESKWIR